MPCYCDTQPLGLGLRLLRWLFDGERARILGLARGRVLDLGTGGGESLRHYPRPLTVVGLDPDPAELQQAAATRGAGLALGRVAARAEALPFLAHSFDTVAGSLVFCSVRDPARAFAEVRRVLRPGGELRLVEHVQPRRGPLRLLVDLFARPWLRLSRECHLDRDTLSSLQAAGFRIRELHGDERSMVVGMVAERDK